MATAALLSLRDRLPPPAAPRARPAAGHNPQARRVLDLASSLFGAGAAALVLATPQGLSVAGATGAPDAEGAVGAACHLFEILAASPPPPEGCPAGVLEEIVPGRGFVAATPVLSPDGRCLGALCLLDGARRSLMTGLQRRLFAEFGGLAASALGGEAAPAAGGRSA